MSKITFEILIGVGLVVLIFVLMRFMQPRLSRKDQYLLRAIQAKSPQLDNLRLYMFIKMIIHPVDEEADLDYQERFFEDSATFKAACGQFESFGAKALYPMIAYEAMNWGLDPRQENRLFDRVTACQIQKHYPRSADIVEELLKNSPDPFTVIYLAQNPKEMPTPDAVGKRCRFDLLNALKVLAETPRNEWWPGTNPDIKEWAANLLTMQ